MKNVEITVLGTFHWYDLSKAIINEAWIHEGKFLLIEGNIENSPESIIFGKK